MLLAARPPRPGSLGQVFFSGVPGERCVLIDGLRGIPQ